MYAECGSMEEALRVFSELPSWDIVTWNAMLQGYAQNGHGEEALKTFWSDVWKGCTAKWYHFSFCSVSL
jgi:hypothetical protein